MWRFKPFLQKEQSGLEGRCIDIGNLKIQVRNSIAEGGFSCVYLARDAVNQMKQYALKHMICNDMESLDLVKKEISIMRMLKGHPNVVALVASSILDLGRTKEALLVMEFCEKSLVSVLESRGAGYYDESKVLLIFRDVCNAVFAMHSQSPPIAHRDLKAENVLLGSDGIWKVCDFGSASTNHRCFDKPEEMGIEEDNIRKHTTPAYRAPEMWDLYRREVISEKVDIWALGCLLYRICYFKSAFDGESKLQILNGNYRIPELPKYSSAVTDLIKDMLQSSPDARPDITQIWFRVNLQLPDELQKGTPDGPSSVTMLDGDNLTSILNDDGNQGSSKRGHVMPRRSPPPPPRNELNSSSLPEKEAVHHKTLGVSKPAANTDPLGAFWSTQYAPNSQVSNNEGPVFDEEPIIHRTFKHSQENTKKNSSPPGEQHRTTTTRESIHGDSQRKYENVLERDFEIRFDQDGGNHKKSTLLPSDNLKKKAPYSDNVAMFQNDAFNTFVAEFDSSKFNIGNSNGSGNGSRTKDLEAEVERLKEQLKQTNLEKAEMTAKFDKLSAICRTQRQEIQELKQALAKSSTTSPLNKENLNTPITSASIQQREKIEGSAAELQHSMFTSSSSTPSPDTEPWLAFKEDKKQQPPPRSSHPRSVRTTGGRQTNSGQTSPSASGDDWGFSQENFSVSSNSQTSKTLLSEGSAQRTVAEAKKNSQPGGWAGF